MSTFSFSTCNMYHEKSSRESLPTFLGIQTQIFGVIRNSALKLLFSMQKLAKSRLVMEEEAHIYVDIRTQIFIVWE